MLYGSVLEIHAYMMGAALLLFVASELLIIPARRGPAKIELHASRLANILVGIGVLAGIVLSYIGGWSLLTPLTPWLVVSFVLIATLVVVGRKFVGPWETMAQSALDTAASGVEVRTFARDKRALFDRISMIALFALVAALMATKPELGLPLS